MNMYKLSLLSLSSLGSFIFFLVGEWNYLLMALVALVAVDYVTGTVAAFIDKSLSSKVGFRGIAKKVFIFALVMMANFMDQVFWPDNHFIRDITILFYILNEMISITENAGRVGLPVPAVIKQAIEKLKNQIK
ncbi:phage holin family protein [Priestia flexa]|uniref:Phage holin family protein n=1 Tax=Priestia flexa TaxID=86664 RepID=A0A8I1MEH1_9BACI|nr:phage holin family protein [Priestia flexa]MBN8250769.1 phage holin family protein [Priestia flexa]MBN8436017.1 phage holin family protein [Priestia flexa]MBY6088443.1 phage holin family protein [Priestia flexa]MCA0968534.1 phage holin family protein [Priestia flexa]MCA1201018.1 phage holin family protein [Priestia flexa]